MSQDRRCESPCLYCKSPCIETDPSLASTPTLRGIESDASKAGPSQMPGTPILKGTQLCTFGGNPPSPLQISSPRAPQEPGAYLYEANPAHGSEEIRRDSQINQFPFFAQPFGPPLRRIRGSITLRGQRSAAVPPNPTLPPRAPTAPLPGYEPFGGYEIDPIPTYMAPEFHHSPYAPPVSPYLASERGTGYGMGTDFAHMLPQEGDGLYSRGDINMPQQYMYPPPPGFDGNPVDPLSYDNERMRQRIDRVMEKQKMLQEDNDFLRARLQENTEKTDALKTYVLEVEGENTVLRRKVEELGRKNSDEPPAKKVRYENPPRLEVMRQNITNTYKDLAVKRCEAMVDSLDILHTLEGEKARLDGPEGVGELRDAISRAGRACKRPFKRVNALQKRIVQDNAWLAEGGLSRDDAEEELYNKVDYYRRNVNWLSRQ